MIAIRSVFPAVLLLSLAACHHEVRPDEKPASVAEALRSRDFFPLRVGDRWTYELRSAGRVAQRTVAITGEQGGFFVDNQQPQSMFRLDAWGVRDRDRYLLQDPLEVGHKWQNVVSVQSTERFEVVEAGRPCSAQAGTFGRCVTVRATNQINQRQALVIESTYAEGVGLVALRTVQLQDGRPTASPLEMQLVSYQLAP